MNTEALHCYTNGTDTVSARDEADAMAVVIECHGGTSPDFDAMTLVPDDRVIAIYLDDAPDPMTCECAVYARENMAERTLNGHHPNCAIGRPRRTAARWAREGRGLVCSTEW